MSEGQKPKDTDEELSAKDLEQAAGGNELTDGDLDQAAGGSIDSFLKLGTLKGG